jgi:hypothetical protein
MIFRCNWAAGSSAGPEGGSIECGFIMGESATVRMPSRLLAALPKDSPDATSGEAVRAKEGERGRVEPDPETEKRLLRERTPFAERGDDGRDRRLGGRGVAETSSLDPSSSGLLVSSSELKADLTGEGSIPCIRMESITSKSPRGSGTLDELDGMPKPARTDLQDRIMRKAARVNKRSCNAHRWPRTAFLIALIHLCDSFASTICSIIIVIPFSSPFSSRRRAPTSTPPTRTTPRRPPTSSSLTKTTLRSFISRRSNSRSSGEEDLNMCKYDAPASMGALRTT